MILVSVEACIAGFCHPFVVKIVEAIHRLVFGGG